MYTIRSAAPFAANDGHVDLTFGAPEGWDDVPYPNMTGGKMASLLLGDPKVGPFVALAFMPPTSEPLKRGTAHGHDSDNWRITLLGESHMGPSTYGPRQFRFQTGGQPYGADDYAAGPRGGFHLVMFGDRRGFPIRPVKQELVDLIAAQNEKAAEVLGIEVPDPYPTAERGLVTNIGMPDKAGKVESSFEDAAAWDELAPGVRAVVGLFGHKIAGPLLVLLQCEPGQGVLEESAFATEVLAMVVAGSCHVGDASYEMGDVRLQEADARFGPVVAGDEGLSLYLLFADRRGVIGKDLASDGWMGSLNDVLGRLTKELAAL